MDLSIIIPVYNTAEFLRCCLDSVRVPECFSYEVLLIDDGSTDGSDAICDEYVAKDCRFRVIHKENEGVSVARNLAIRQVYGDYIWFIDSDDYLAQGAISRCLDLIQNHPDIDVFVAPMLIFFENRIEASYLSYRIEESFTISGKSFMKEKRIQSVGPPQFVIRRNLFRNTWLSFPEGMRFEDEYFARVLKYLDGKFLVLKEHFYVYRQWSGSHMNSLQVKSSQDIIKVYRKLDEFAGSVLSQQDQAWFRNDIVSFLLESYTRNSRFFSTEEFRSFKKANDSYVRSQWKRYCRYFSLKDRILANILLLSPSTYRFLLNVHNVYKLKRNAC